MTARAKALLEEALGLPADEREALAGALLDSLDGEAGEVDAAWALELEGRAGEALAGTSGSRDFDEAIADVAAELRRGR